MQLIKLRSLTPAVQQCFGLEVELRRVWFGRRRAQAAGRNRERLLLAEGLCAVCHVLPLLLDGGLGGRVGQLLGDRVRSLLDGGLGPGVGHGSRALHRRSQREGETAG